MKKIFCSLFIICAAHSSTPSTDYILEIYKGDFEISGLADKFCKITESNLRRISLNDHAIKENSDNLKKLLMEDPVANIDETLLFDLVGAFKYTKAKMFCLVTNEAIDFVKAQFGALGERIFSGHNGVYCPYKCPSERHSTYITFSSPEEIPDADTEKDSKCLMSIDDDADITKTPYSRKDILMHNLLLVRGCITLMDTSYKKLTFIGAYGFHIIRETFLMFSPLALDFLRLLDNIWKNDCEFHAISGYCPKSANSSIPETINPKYQEFLKNHIYKRIQDLGVKDIRGNVYFYDPINENARLLSIYAGYRFFCDLKPDEIADFSKVRKIIATKEADSELGKDLIEIISEHLKNGIPLWRQAI